MGVPEQAESFTPRVALFSGPLVFAEALGVKKKSISKHFASSSSPTSKSSLHKEKDKSAKKNKYVLKRRDEHNSSPLPDAYFSQKQKQKQQPPSFIITDSTAENSDYVLQKREAAEDSKPDLSTAFNIEQKNNAESPQTPPLPVTENNVDEKPASYADGAAIKKQKEKKIKKRSLEDVADHEAKMLKKKKKKKHRDGLSASEAGHETSRASENFIPSPRPVSPPAVDLGPLDQLDLLSVFGDLKSLALNPFYGLEHKTPLIARHVFLRFRSLVYSKSLVLPAPSEADAQGEVQLTKPSAAVAAASIAPAPSNKDAKEQQRDQGSSLKPAKLMKRGDDPTKGGKKRAPSDRQEEMSAKRMKKVSQMKSLASEKKAALAQKASDGPSTAEPAKKPEKQEPLLPTPPKRESPTYLIMKFPRGSTLPSVANLKARFARFGPLAVDSTRVFWKSHSCRVQFKYKPDALGALSYVKSNDIFGQVQVDYSVREVEAPAPEPQPEPAQFRPGNGSGSSSAAQSRHGSQQSQPQGKLKSILKKPGDEAGKENQRVKFMLSDTGNGDNSKLDSPPPPLSASGGAGFTDVAPPQPRPSKSTSFQLAPPPPPQPRQTLMQPSLPPLPPARSYEPHNVLHPPPQHLQMPLPPPAPLRPVENRQGPPAQFSEARHQVQEVKSRNKNVDISHQMMSLLLRCNDIVSSLRSLPGFVPYRPM